MQLRACGLQRKRLGSQHLNTASVLQGLQLIEQGLWGVEHGAAVHQGHAGGLVGQCIDGSLHGQFITTVHQYLLALQRQAAQIGRVVVHAVADQGFNAFDLDGLGHKGAHACRNHHGLGQQLCACGSAQQPAAIVLLLQRLDLLAQMQRGGKWGDLLTQALYQFGTGAGLDAGQVINGLVRIQLGTLAAQMGQGVNQMDMQALQPELEHLKHARCPCAYDGDVGCNGGTRVQVFGGHRRIRQLKSPIAGAVQIESVRSKRGLNAPAVRAYLPYRSIRRHQAGKPYAW